MGRWENPLTLEGEAEIVRHAGELTPADVARRLGKNYFTVAKSRSTSRQRKPKSSERRSPVYTARCSRG